MALDNKQIKKCCSIRDVAEYVGVSAATVSRILNGRQISRISESTRQKVQSAVRELNYTPNVNAQRLFTRRSRVIGLVVPSFEKMQKHIFEDNHLTHIISGLEKGLEAQEYSILLIFNNAKFEKNRRFLDLFRSSSIDGMIIWGAYENEKFWQDLVAESFPYLFLTNVPEMRAPVNYITNDCDQAGFLLADHMLSRGHRRLAWVEGKSGISLTRAQRDGITRALALYGMTMADVVVLSGDFTTEYGYAAAEKLCHAGPDRVTAVITANMETAIGVKHYAEDNDFRIPDDLAIGCCNSLWSYKGEEQIMTRIRVDDLAIGECAAQRILQLVDDPAVLVQHRYGIELVVGKTS